MEIFQKKNNNNYKIKKIKKKFYKGHISST